MERTGKSLESVASEILCEGLRFKVKPHAFRFRAGIDLDRIGQFADELEDEELSIKLTADGKP